MQLFDKLLWTPPPAKEGRPGHDDFLAAVDNPDTYMESSLSEGFNGIFPAGFDMWQSHPVLGNLFDMPFDSSALQGGIGETTGFTPCFDGSTYGTN